MDFIDRSLVIVDLETTVFDPLVHEVIDIGAVRGGPGQPGHRSDLQCQDAPAISNWRIRSHFRSTLYPVGWRHAVDPRNGWLSFFAFGRQGVFASYSTRFDWAS